jgi:CheY-like chemotaxis protein
MAQSIQGQGMTRNGGELSVLIVEDEPLVLDMISRELTGRGFSVIEADNAETALAIIDSGQPVDVLFTDIRLPGDMDGWRLAATVRQSKPRLPVIYATGYSVERTAQVPGSVFLNKPYRPAVIAQTIRNLVAAGEVANR